jgi:hypothetical protein
MCVISSTKQSNAFGDLVHSMKLVLLAVPSGLQIRWRVGQKSDGWFLFMVGSGLMCVQCIRLW